MHTHLQPEDWLKPRGYSNGVIASGQQMIFSGGLIGWNKQCEFETDSFIGQLQQTLENIVDILREADAGPRVQRVGGWMSLPNRVQGAGFLFFKLHSGQTPFQVFEFFLQGIRVERP